MQSSSLAHFRVRLGSVFSVYGKELGEDILAIWWGAMKPYNLQEIDAALRVHVANPDLGQYCPKPADVIKTITDKAKKEPIERCWNCQGDLAQLGRTKLLAGYVCNPCYQGYLNSEWSPGRVA